MRARRGVAMLAALWLVVAIAAVALQLSLEAKERRSLGIDAAERGVARAATLGALAVVHSRLDMALRQMAGANPRVAGLRASDPWLDADSLHSGPVKIDSAITVDVRARDLGTMVNVNQIGENDLRTFFGFVLQDYAVADQLAESIMDWRDVDDNPRARGGERDQYLRQGRLVLPGNQPFREVEDLLHVQGMTEERLAAVSPYLTTRGNGLVNLNSAPVPVLRALPGMTDIILANILSLRSQGQRIQSVAQVMSAATRGRPPAEQARFIAAATERLQTRATVQVQQVELTLIARAGPQAAPERLTAIVQRQGSNASITSRLW